VPLREKLSAQPRAKTPSSPRLFRICVLGFEVSFYFLAPLRLCARNYLLSLAPRRQARQGYCERLFMALSFNEKRWQPGTKKAGVFYLLFHDKFIFHFSL
jgi:hypothetical protein